MVSRCLHSRCLHSRCLHSRCLLSRCLLSRWAARTASPRPRSRCISGAKGCSSTRGLSDRTPRRRRPPFCGICSTASSVSASVRSFSLPGPVPPLRCHHLAPLPDTATHRCHRSLATTSRLCLILPLTGATAPLPPPRASARHCHSPGGVGRSIPITVSAQRTNSSTPIPREWSSKSPTTARRRSARRKRTSGVPGASSTLAETRVSRRRHPRPLN